MRVMRVAMTSWMRFALPLFRIRVSKIRPMTG